MFKEKPIVNDVDMSSLKVLWQNGLRPLQTLRTSHSLM